MSFRYQIHSNIRIMVLYRTLSYLRTKTIINPAKRTNDPLRIVWDWKRLHSTTEYSMPWFSMVSTMVITCLWYTYLQTNEVSHVMWLLVRFTMRYLFWASTMTNMWSFRNIHRHNKCIYLTKLLFIYLFWLIYIY